MLIVVAFLFGLVAMVGLAFGMAAICENVFGNPRPATRWRNRRFYNLDLCPAIERLEPIILLAVTTWQGGEDGDFGDNTQWNMGAPGANDIGIFESGEWIDVEFANVATALAIAVDDAGMGATDVTFDLGQKTHSFEQLYVSKNSSSLELTNGTISSAAQSEVHNPFVEANTGAYFLLEAGATIQGEHRWENLSESRMIIAGKVNNHTDSRTPGVLTTTSTKGVKITGDAADARFSEVNIATQDPDGLLGPAEVLVENGAFLNVLGAIKIGKSGFGKLTLQENGLNNGEEARVYANVVQVGPQENDWGGEVLVQGGTSIVAESYEQFSTGARSNTKVMGENSRITSDDFTLAGGDLIIEEGGRVITLINADVWGTNTPRVTVTGAGSLWDYGGTFTFGDPGGKSAQVMVSDGGIVSSLAGNIVQRANGWLMGNSTIKANQYISQDNAAWILPGLGGGDMDFLTLDGDWDASGGVTYFVDVDGPSGVSDQIHVTGTATLGGVLHVSLGGTTPVGPTEYLIVVADEGLSGGFNLAGSHLPTLPPGLYWTAVYGQDAIYGYWYAKLVIFEPLLSITGLGSYGVGEADGTAIFTVTLDNGQYLTQNVLVDYETLDYTATAGADYVAASGTLTFTPLQTYQTIEVTIIDDSEIEDMEEFSVQLSNGRLQDGRFITLFMPGDSSVIHDNDFEEPPDPLMASTPPSSTVTPQTLELSDLKTVIHAAARYWHTEIDVDQLEFEIADLPGSILAVVIDQRIIIDVDAAGHGWFVDDTPRDRREFRRQPGTWEFTAVADSAAEGRMDLLTVLIHELGHVLGRDDLDSTEHPHHVMSSTLTAGTRRLPSLQSGAGLSGFPAALAGRAND